MTTESQYQNDIAQAEKESAREAHHLLNNIHGSIIELMDSARNDHGIDYEYCTDDTIAMLRQVDKRLKGIADQIVNRQATDDDYRDQIEAEMVELEHKLGIAEENETEDAKPVATWDAQDFLDYFNSNPYSTHAQRIAAFMNADGADQVLVPVSTLQNLAGTDQNMAMALLAFEGSHTHIFNTNDEDHN